MVSSIFKTDSALDRRRQLALAIQQQALGGNNPQSIGETLARLGAAFVSNKKLGKLDERASESRKTQAADLAKILSGSSTPGINPIGQEQLSELLGSPETQDLGLQLALQERSRSQGDKDFERNADLQRELAGMRSGSKVGTKVVPGVGLVDSQTGRVIRGVPTLAEQLSGIGDAAGGFEASGVDIGPRGSTLKLQRKPTRGEQIARELSPAQKKIDEKFATEFVDFQAAGGFAKIEKNLDQLDSAAEALRNNPSLTGTIVGNLPDALLAATNPQALEVRQDVELVITETLRQLIGAQFTKEEGENLIRRTVDPRLPEEVNVRRIERLVKQIRTAAQAKVSANDYLIENGTLRGFRGKIFTKSDIINTPLPKKIKKSKGLNPSAEEGVDFVFTP